MKTLYIDKLDDIVNKYNNTFHSTTKMKPTDIKASTYFNFGVGNNEQKSYLKIYGWWLYKNIEI